MNQDTSKTSTINPLIEDLTDSVTRAFTQEVFIVLTVAIIVYIRHKLINFLKRQKLKKQYFNKNCYLDKIQTTMVDLLTISEADRVVLLQFHDGDSFLGDFEQLKVTLTRQVTNKAIVPIPNIIALPISCIYREIEKLKINPREITWIIRDEAYAKCANYLDSIGVELYGAKMLFNKNKIPVGIIGFHFCSKDYIYFLSDEGKVASLDYHISLLEKLL